MEKIINLKFCGGSTDDITQKHASNILKISNMLGYMWELTYGLCISPAYDVSSSFGFEGAMGTFKEIEN